MALFVVILISFKNNPQPVTAPHNNCPIPHTFICIIPESYTSTALQRWHVRWIISGRIVANGGLVKEF